MAKELTRYGKALGAGDRVNRHAAGLLDSAKKKNVAQLKKELAATQRDVEAELVTLRDADLAHLISLGGWIRALEVSTVAVDKQFSVERARKVMREDIADYYTESVAGLEPRISERPNYLAMRNLLAGLRNGDGAQGWRGTDRGENEGTSANRRRNWWNSHCNANNDPRLIRNHRGARAGHHWLAGVIAAHGRGLAGRLLEPHAAKGLPGETATPGGGRGRRGGDLDLSEGRARVARGRRRASNRG